MARLLIEYKGVPGIIEHTFEKVDNVTYIVVYKAGEYTYLRKDFKSVDEALNHETGNELKLVFIYLQSKANDDLNYVLYKQIQFANRKFIITDAIETTYKYYKLNIYFGLDSFRISKTKTNTSSPSFDIYYTRRKTVKNDTKKTFVIIDSFYELVPRYEDIFLETIFFLDILKVNIDVVDKSEIEAYFLQAKIRIEEKKKIPKHKDSRVDDQPPVSEEQITLEKLIGLEKVKLEIQELKALANFRKQRIEYGLPVTPTTLHMVFTGNPGTGKTTVARLLGQIYHDIGILPENKVVEASRQDLIGEYVGHTAPKTQKLFEKAIGGILFIDEAYSLFKTGNDFGKEAVETLLKLMEDNREKIVVIIAGYPKEMSELLSSNPGLKSRFSKFLHFDDYNKEELLQIFSKTVSDYGNKLTEGAKFKIEHLIDTYYDTGAFTANARSVRNIFEETSKKQSLRLSELENPSQDEMTTFIDKDLPNTVE